LVNVSAARGRGVSGSAPNGRLGDLATRSALPAEDCPHVAGEQRIGQRRAHIRGAVERPLRAQDPNLEADVTDRGARHRQICGGLTRALRRRRREGLGLIIDHRGGYHSTRPERRLSRHVDRAR